MQQYIARRVLLFVPTVVLVTLLLFLFLRIIPGDPALMILTGHSGTGNYTLEELNDLRHELGTDRPIHVQYGEWMWQMLRGDLGTSYIYRIPLTTLLEPRIYLTLELTALSILISFILAVPLGVISALARNKFPDYAARVFTLVGLSVPNFVVGIVTIYLLVRLFNWFPPLDYTPPWEDFTKNMQQLIFPALTTAFFFMAFIARITRSSMLEVMREDYIRTARAKGLRERSVLFRHALRNSFLPILTVTGWAFGVIVGGQVIIERIYGLPGMGQILVDSIFNRDYPVIQTEVFLVAFIVLFLNLLVDITYAWVDPRIRFG